MDEFLEQKNPNAEYSSLIEEVNPFPLMHY